MANLVIDIKYQKLGMINLVENSLPLAQVFASDCSIDPFCAYAAHDLASNHLVGFDRAVSDIKILPSLCIVCEPRYPIV